jgi:hypothetical protein
MSLLRRCQARVCGYSCKLRRLEGQALPGPRSLCAWHPGCQRSHSIQSQNSCKSCQVDSAKAIGATREISVVFGALVGILFLKENGSSLRLAGAVLISLGVAAVALLG